MYKIILKNEHFVIVDKDPLVLSVPSRLGESEERGILGLELQKDLKTQIYPVHRLDFEVSGLIMYALTPEAQKAGNRWFEQKIVTKTYMAITAKNPQIKDVELFSLNQELVWKCLLLRGKKRAYEGAHGKRSETLAKLVKKEGEFLVWELNPVTGRSHQLRYEMFRHHFPIVGDVLYSSDQDSALVQKIFPKLTAKGIALRAFKIDFTQAPDHKQFQLPEFISVESFL